MGLLDELEASRFLGPSPRQLGESSFQSYLQVNLAVRRGFLSVRKDLEPNLLRRVCGGAVLDRLKVHELLVGSGDCTGNTRQPSECLCLNVSAGASLRVSSGYDPALGS